MHVMIKQVLYLTPKAPPPTIRSTQLNALKRGDVEAVRQLSKKQSMRPRTDVRAAVPAARATRSRMGEMYEEGNGSSTKGERMAGLYAKKVRKAREESVREA